MSKEQDQSADRDEPVDGAPATPGGAGAGDHDAPGEPGGAGGIRSTSGGLVVTAVGQTDVGRQRSVNQDSLGNLAQNYAAQAEQLGLLYAVADGMGGHSRGEVASALAIETIFGRYYASDPQEQPAAALARIIRDTNATVHQAGRAGEGGGNMGTTLTIALLRDDTLYVGNVGDSRTYRIRGDQIEQLTRDHSLIQEQIDRDLLTPEEARQSNIRNVITRAVGYRERVEPDTFTYPVAAGDIILLCSDGLHGLVEDRELAEVFAAQPLEVAVPTLIELARERGGHDNITALAIRVDAVGAPSAGSLDKTEPFDLLLPSPDESTDRFPTIKPDTGEAADSAATEASDATAPTAPTAPAGTASAASLANERGAADSPEITQPDDATNVASVAPTAAAAATLTTTAAVAGPSTPPSAAAPNGTTADTSAPTPPPPGATETSAPPAATAPPPPPPALPASDASSPAPPPAAPAAPPSQPLADTSPAGPPPSVAETSAPPAATVPPPPPAVPAPDASSPAPPPPAPAVPPGRPMADTSPRAPTPERRRRVPVWLLVLVLLVLLALVAGAIAARVWNRRAAAPSPASAATVVVPGPTPLHRLGLPADLRAGTYTLVLRQRDPLTVRAQPPTSGERELTRA